MTSTSLRTLAVLLCTIAVLSSACGYRGPLYLPDEQPPGAGAETPAQPGSADAQTDDEDSKDEEDEG